MFFFFCLGRALGSDQKLCRLGEWQRGSCKSYCENGADVRWDQTMLMGVKQTQITEQTGYYDSIESMPDPHAYAEGDLSEPSGDDTSRRRRVRMTLADLQARGFSDGCPRCGLHSRGEQASARPQAY